MSKPQLVTEPRRGTAPVERRRRAWWRRYATSRGAVAGLVILGAVGVVALAAALIAPGNPSREAGAALMAPSWRHWFGTDNLGRDAFASVVHGTGPTIVVGVLAAAISGVLGTAVGGISGFVGGLVDDALMRLAEVVVIIPQFLLVIVIAVVFNPSLAVVTVVLGLTFWPTTARLVRAEVASVKERPYVLAGRSIGLRSRQIFFRYVLPNVYPVALVSTALQVGLAILTEAGLAFLGLGNPSALNWGTLLQNAQPFVVNDWWLSVFPGVAIAVVIVSVNLVSDGLVAGFGLPAARSGSAVPAGRRWFGFGGGHIAPERGPAVLTGGER